MTLLPIFGAFIGFGFGWWIEGFLYHLHERYESMYKVTLFDKIYNGVTIVKLIILLYIISILEWDANDSFALLSAICFYFYFHRSAMYQRRNYLSIRNFYMGWISDGGRVSEGVLDKQFPFLKLNKFRMAVFLLGIIFYFIYGITN
jgi:hypothetical protein